MAVQQMLRSQKLLVVQLKHRTGCHQVGVPK